MSLQLKGNWNQIKGELKQKYANLTDDDLMYLEGEEDKVLGRLQEKTGESAQSLREKIFEEKN